jgi:hypothetical protein
MHLCGILLLAGLFCLSGAQANSEAEREYAMLASHLAARPTGEARQRLQRETLRPDALIADADRDPLDVVLRRSAALLRHLAGDDPEGFALESMELTALTKDAAASRDSARRKALFYRARELRRRIVFRNPLLNFDRIVFATHHKALYNHMCDQYFGFHAKPGGGILVLRDPFGDAPRVVNILAGREVANGRLKGQQLQNGSFISLELSYDAETIFFAWTEAARIINSWTPESTYHIFSAPVSGGPIQQLTDGEWNDFDPCLLPNGRVAFISERRGGYLRCGQRPDPVYTLHSMRADGSDIIRLSHHETHEWHPSVNNDGMIVYTRWDYVDRDSDVAHHIWLTFPDGRDPRSPHGNYPLERELRPWMELGIRAIPNSERYVAVAAPHHGQNYGSLIQIDPRVPDDQAMSQVKRITPQVRFPESEISPGVARYSKRTTSAEVYSTPWPLSEDFYLCVYDSAAKHHGLYLLDSFGNEELLYRDAQVPCLDPIPLRARSRPPVLPARTEQAAEDRKATTTNSGTVAIMNIYESRYPWPADTRITALRIIQLFPKTTAPANEPKIGIGDQSLARGVLGTVPVEPDGSVFFRAPSDVPLYFQALDGQRMAVQSMRSATYLHPGERLSCVGCHQPPGQTNPIGLQALAFQRPPSVIEPEAEGAFPLSFPRLVQEVLDRNCRDCHAQQKACSLAGDSFGKWGWSTAYHSLAPFAWAKHGGNGSLRRNKTSYSVPGQVGARASRLLKLLTSYHHGLSLADDDLHRLTLWLDCNSVFYGSYHETEEQAIGKLVQPRLY